MLSPGVYRNKNNFPTGTYRNRDRIRENSIFARVDGQDLYLETDFKKFQGHSIEREFYFNPSYFPIPFLGDYKKGSCFVGWFVPTSAYQLDVLGDTIHVSTPPQDISLDTYKKTIDHLITKSINDVYDRYPEAYLHYSGGIDCLVILSYIIKLGYLKRTHLVYHKNLTQSYDPAVSYQDPELRTAIQDAFDRFSDQCAGTRVMEFDVKDVAHCANIGDYFSLTTYTTTRCMEHYRNTAHFHGTLGNSTLLHFKSICDELIRVNGNRDEFDREKNTPGHYSVYLYEHDPSSDIIPLSDRHLGNKLFNHLMPDPRGNCLSTPLATDEMIFYLRKTDFSGLSHREIFESRFSLDLIQQNVGDTLDCYVIRGGQNENDNLKNISVPLDLLREDILRIPDLNHHPEGREWLEYEIDRARTTGHVAINTLTSFLAQQRLHSMTK